jgi:hypothetical protein
MSTRPSPGALQICAIMSTRPRKDGPEISKGDDGCNYIGGGERAHSTEHTLRNTSPHLQLQSRRLAPQSQAVYRVL